jgi:hypothetical protein
MDIQAVVHMEMLHLSVLMQANRDTQFRWLPETTQQQIDAALWVRRDIKRATPELLQIMKKPDEFGFWAVHAHSITYGKNPPNPLKLYKHAAKAVVVARNAGSRLDYMKSFGSAFQAVDEAGLDTQAFVAEFLFQARRAKDPLVLKYLLWKLPEANLYYEQAQAQLFKVFQAQEGFRDFLLANTSITLLKRLVLDHSLSGFEREIGRKGRGQKLCYELGL